MNLVVTNYLSFIPVHTCCMLLGMDSVYKTKKGEFKRCFFSLLLAIAYISLYMTVFITCGGKSRSTHTMLNYQSYIITVIKESYYFGNAAVMCCVYFACHLLYPQEFKALCAFEEIDQILRRLGLNEELQKKHYYIFKVGLAVTFGVYIVYFLILEIVLHVLLFPEISGIVDVLESIFPTIIISTMKIQVYTCMLTLRTRIEILNDYLESKIERSMKSTKLGTFFSFGKHIERILKIHKKIVDATRDVNRLFAVQLLLSFGLLFVLFLADGYIVLYYLTVGRSDNIGYVLFSCLKLILFHIGELLVLLRSCMLVCSKVNQTKDILYKTKINPENSEARDIIIVSTFQLMHDKLEITACDLFNIDYEFLFSMCASMTTYLLILLQFDIEAAKMSVYTNTTSLNETYVE